MKKCPFCGWSVEDEATRCEHCFAGIPHEEPKHKETKEAEKKTSASKKK